jgi:hypothetical protein
MKRCFLVGCGRSGTTFVTASLGRHPAVFVMPETIFFRHVVGMVRLRGPSPKKGWLGMRAVNTVRAALLRCGYGRLPPRAATARLRRIGEHLGITSLTTCTLPRTRNLQHVARHFVSLIDGAAQNCSCQAWIEQSPIHLRYLDCIEQYIPEVRIIHVVRDGRAVVASLWDAAQKYDGWRRMFPTVDFCIETWNANTACSKTYLQKPNHFYINYHRFAANVHLGVQATARFLGVDPAASLVANRDVARVALPEQEWLRNVGGEARDGGLKKFRSLFSEAEQHRIESALTDAGSADWCPYESTLNLTQHPKRKAG